MRHREAMRLKPGDVVWAETMSGAPIECCVVETMETVDRGGDLDVVAIDDSLGLPMLGRHYMELTNP